MPKLTILGLLFFLAGISVIAIHAVVSGVTGDGNQSAAVPPPAPLAASVSPTPSGKMKPVTEYQLWTKQRAEANSGNTNQNRSFVPANNNSAAVKVNGYALTVTPSGFEPASIHQPAGPLMIAVFNRTGAPHLTVQVKNQNGTLIDSFVVDIARGAGRFNLPAGNYTLAIAEIPSFTGSIQIAP